jgi:hypothetical protein
MSETLTRHDFHGNLAPPSTLALRERSDFHAGVAYRETPWDSAYKPTPSMVTLPVSPRADRF